jgi:predicted phage tail protein
LSKISAELEDKDAEIYEKFKQYVKSKYGKLKGVLGEELAKAIQFYLQHLKASEGTPQSPQPQLPTEKAKEGKPISVTKTAKELTKASEELTKRIEDLTQRTENLEKELKATGETVKSLTKNIADIGNKIDEYVKQRLEQALKTIMPKLIETIKEAISHEIDEHCFIFCGLPEEKRKRLEELLRPSLEKLKGEVKSEVLKAIKEEQEKEVQEEKKGFLW